MIQTYIKKHLREGLQNQTELDSILDKISSGGLESLSRYERMRLDKTSRSGELPSVTEWIEHHMGFLVEETQEDKFQEETSHHYYTQEGLRVMSLFERMQGPDHLVINKHVLEEMARDLQQEPHELKKGLEEYLKQTYYVEGPLKMSSKQF